MRESRRYQLYGLVALLLLPGLDASMGWQQLTTDTDYSSKAAGLRSLASITDALSGSDGTSSSGHAVLPILSGWPSGQLSVNVTWGSASSSPNQPSKVLKFEVGQPSPTPATASGSSSPDGNISSSGSDDSSNSSGAALQASPAAKTTAANESLHAAATSSIPVDGEQLPYTYDRVNGHEGNPLGLAIADTPGLALSSWVMCAWAVSNFSSPEMLNDTIMSNVESLINNFTVMAPGQVSGGKNTPHRTAIDRWQFCSQQWQHAEHSPSVTGAAAALAAAASGRFDGHQQMALHDWLVGRD